MATIETQYATDNAAERSVMQPLDSNALAKGQRMTEEELNRYDLSLIEQVGGQVNTFRTYINGTKVIKVQNFGTSRWQINDITRLEDLTTGQIGHLMHLKTKSHGGVTD